MNEYISREAVINITAETGAWETQNRVRDLPAADVQPVKHAKWIEAQDKHGSYFMCSNCGTAEKIESDQGGTVWRHDEYCRKCGARMDGDTNG